MANLDPVDKALQAITPILFDGKEPTEIDFASENAHEVVNLELKKAWINWVLGDVDNVIEKINLGAIDGTPLHARIPQDNLSLNAKVILTGQSSQELAHKLAYEIEPKLRMIKDVQRSLEKLEYLSHNKNDPDYKRCAFNLNTTLQYLMTDVQPQLEQFLNITDIDTGLAGLEQSLVKEYSSTHMVGGRRRRRRKSSKKGKSRRKGKGKKRRKSKSKGKGKRRRKSKSKGKRRASRKRRRRSPKRRRSAKPMTKWAW